MIGLYPLLHEGGYVNCDGDGPVRSSAGMTAGIFSYQSCTQARPGYVEGTLQFRPGSIAQPKGEIFDVKVARFPLRISEFLY